MQTMIKTGVIALTILAGASAVQAGETGFYSGYADWAQTAFETKN